MTVRRAAWIGMVACWGEAVTDASGPSDSRMEPRWMAVPSPTRMRALLIATSCATQSVAHAIMHKNATRDRTTPSIRLPPTDIVTPKHGQLRPVTAGQARAACRFQQPSSMWSLDTAPLENGCLSYRHTATRGPPASSRPVTSKGLRTGPIPPSAPPAPAPERTAYAESAVQSGPRRRSRRHRRRAACPLRRGPWGVRGRG